jgi:hypothetical protein
LEPVNGPVAEPTKETEEFAQSSGARESSNDVQHVQPPARLAASKVFIIKRFNRCHLDVKQFLPTLGHTQLENVRYEDIQSRLASGSDPPHHTTAPEQLRGVDIEGLDTTVKTMAGSRDDCSLHTMTGVSIGRSPVLICEKMTEVNCKYVPSKYKINRLGPGPEPPPASDVWSLGFGDVKLTFLMVYIRRTFTFVFRTQGVHSRGQQHSLMSYYVDYHSFLERPAGKKYCHYNYLDGQLYKHKWAIRKGFTRWLQVKLSLRPIGVMGSHFYHLQYGERLEHSETIDAVDIEKTKFAAPGSDTGKLKELDGDDRDTGGGDTSKLTEPGGAHVEVVTAKELHRLREIRLQRVREEAIDRNLEYWKERSLKHDAGLRRHTYQVGDLVLVQNYALANGFGRPWDRRWKGPFKITHISRKGKVDLVDSIGTRLRGWHTDKLQPYHLRRSNQSEYEEFKVSVQLAKETLATVVAGGIVVELQ